jgi:hypothetical protein
MYLFYTISDYFFWHYTEGYAYSFSFWKNILWMIHRLFSTKTLLKTIFVPWRRLDFEYSKNFDISEYMSNLIINTLMRIIGFLIKSIVISASLVFTIITLTLMAVFFVIWTALPVFIISLFLYGIKIL